MCMLIKQRKNVFVTEEQNTYRKNIPKLTVVLTYLSKESVLYQEGWSVCINKASRAEYFLGFQVPTAATMKVTAFCVIALCSFIEVRPMCKRCVLPPLLLWWWRQYAPVKCLYTSTRLNGATTQKTLTWLNIVCQFYVVVHSMHAIVYASTLTDVTLEIINHAFVAVPD
jgi:hypothetical protein